MQSPTMVYGIYVTNGDTQEYVMRKYSLRIVSYGLSNLSLDSLSVLFELSIV